MRIPASKVYRAFPELDLFSDDECVAYVRHVRRRCRVPISVSAFAVGLATMFGTPILLALVGPAMPSMPDVLAGVILVLAIGGLFTGPLWGFLARDALLRRAIRERLGKSNCPECGYSLLGLRAAHDQVKCPECGETVTLSKHGLTEQDLVAERTGGAQPTSASPSDSP